MAGFFSRFRMRNTMTYRKNQFAWEKCMKYFLCALNALIMIGGLTVIGVGTWTVVDKLSLESLLGTNLYISAAWILIGTGCAVVCIAVFGCFGAIRGVRCMLMTYFIILFCIFFILLLGGILGYIFRDQLDESMRQQMHDTMIRDYGFVDVVNDAWDVLQQALGCCAVDEEYSLANWKHSRWHEKQVSPRPLLPATCCRLVNDALVDGKMQYVNLTECQGRLAVSSDWPNPAYVYVQPCLGMAKQEVKQHAVVLGSVGVSIAGLLMFGMIFAMCLFREIE